VLDVNSFAPSREFRRKGQQVRIPTRSSGSRRAVDLTQNELRKRVWQFLKRERSAFMMRRSRSSYFFNFIWFQTGESFRTRAWTTAEFENNMQSVEAHCDKIVAENWRSCEHTRRPLDVAAARQLIRTLEERLRSNRRVIQFIRSRSRPRKRKLLPSSSRTR
jgi:hypothetical protein